MALRAKIVTKIKSRANLDGKEKNERANIVLIYLRRVISGLFSQRYLHTVLTCWVKLRRVISGLFSRLPPFNLHWLKSPEITRLRYIKTTFAPFIFLLTIITRRRGGGRIGEWEGNILNLIFHTFLLTFGLLAHTLVYPLGWWVSYFAQYCYML